MGVISAIVAYMNNLVTASILRAKAPAFSLLLALSFTSCVSRVTKLRQEGDNLVHLVEAYRLHQGRLPASLAELDLVETEAGPLYYRQSSPTAYQVWFGTSLGESETYSSQTKKWGQ
jgi:hypothetical protein